MSYRPENVEALVVAIALGMALFVGRARNLALGGVSLMGGPIPFTAIVAAEAFIGAMRREALKRHPDEEPRVPLWADMPEADRGVIVRAIRIAIRATEPANVQRVLEERGLEEGREG
jgi:hypothetical protein